MTSPRAVVRNIVRRTWADYQISTNLFFTVTTFSPYTGWCVEIGKDGQWVATKNHKTEGAAREIAVRLANKRWPLSV